MVGLRPNVFASPCAPPSARGARRRAPLAAPSGTCAHSRAQLIGFRAGGRLAKVVAKAFWSGMTRGKRTGGEQTAVRSPMSAQPAERRCTSSPAAFSEGRARCTGHLGGRLRRQRSNLRNLFAWDLVDPVAYRPIPLASLDIIAAPRRNSCPKTPFLQRRRFRQTLRRLGRLPAPDPGGCYYGSMWRLRAPSSAEAPPT